MKVILTQEILGLGDIGEELTVKDGYGRNFLLPKGFAIEASKKNIKTVNAERKRLAIKTKKIAEKAKEQAENLKDITISIFTRVGRNDKLYGSVTNMDLSAKLSEQGFNIDKRRIILKNGPLKNLGSYTVPIKLHSQVIVDIQVILKSKESDDSIQEEKNPNSLD